MGRTGPTKPNENYGKQVDELRAFLTSRESLFGKSECGIQPETGGMQGLFDGSQNLYCMLMMPKESWNRCCLPKLLARKNLWLLVPMKLGWLPISSARRTFRDLERTHSLPTDSDTDIDQPFKTAKTLFDNKILFCFSYAGDMEAMGSRNLPFSAGTAVAYGLKYEEAVKALTLNTAKILGVDASCGTLESGKDATLFVSSGDALDMMTNDVIYAWIAGRTVDLDNPQKYLYRKFKGKAEN
ncbi:MAG: amidohydrolase family protein [Flavobacteriales bacterium]|nr:amidohydrolase family protein [Flavobacteriales bacterium]